MILNKNYNENTDEWNYFNIPEGKHECVIKDINVYTTLSGKEALKIMLDIEEGSVYDNCFMNYYNNTGYWASEATKVIPNTDECVSYMGNFISSVIKSNPNCMVFAEAGKELDLNQFIDLKVIAVFQKEEYQTKDGEIKNSLAVKKFSSIFDENQDDETISTANDQVEEQEIDIPNGLLDDEYPF